jgi:hypothetical protein
MALKSIVRSAAAYGVPGIIRGAIFPLINPEDGTVGFTIARTSGVVTTFTVESPVALLEFEPGTGTATEVLNVGSQRNLKQSVGGRVAQVSDASLAVMKELNLREHCILVEVSAGNYWFFGEDRGLVAETNEGGFGTDTVGNNLLLSGLSTSHKAKISAVLADVVFATAFATAVAS